MLPAVDDDYRAFLRAELDAWKEGNPRAVRFLQTLDHAAAVARPAITISLAVSGWVLAGDLVGQAAVHTAGHLATEAAIAGGITGGGEALVSTTSEGVRQAAARLFRRLQSRYAQQRARWLADWLERELFGDLLDECIAARKCRRRPPLSRRKPPPRPCRRASQFSKHIKRAAGFIPAVVSGCWDDSCTVAPERQYNAAPTPGGGLV